MAFKHYGNVCFRKIIDIKLLRVSFLNIKTAHIVCGFTFYSKRKAFAVRKGFFIMRFVLRVMTRFSRYQLNDLNYRDSGYRKSNGNCIFCEADV